MFHCLPDSARADGNLEEPAGKLVKMVEHQNQSQPNPVHEHMAHPVDETIFYSEESSKTAHSQPTPTGGAPAQDEQVGGGRPSGTRRHLSTKIGLTARVISLTSYDERGRGSVLESDDTNLRPIFLTRTL